MLRRCGLLFAPLLLAGLPRPMVAAVNFQRDVRPILSGACFACHGPDQSTRMVGLRLDIPEGAFARRPNGAPVVPGKPAESLLYRRISEENLARRMPPPASHKNLTDAQKETLRQWIAEGASWKQQWSFIAPTRPDPPAVRDAKWVRNPIDRFILARLEANGLAPSAEAGRRELIRRVSLDLRGLPPSPEEVAAFVNDRGANAYEKMVDRYLASPQFGEHRAHYWLDAARYGDTNGLHYDNYRGGIWHYRDWVVDAFNRNLSYDQFVIQQLAGDLLPQPTLDQLIATGFTRNNVTTNENGVIEDEIAVMYAKDRADTTGTVFLGLTTGCATCHDHKFDPISQKDHYALEAFFNNTTQMIMDDNRPDAPPIVFVPQPEDRDRWLAVNRERTALMQKLAALRKVSTPEFERWTQSNDSPGRKPLADDSETFAVAEGEGIDFTAAPAIKTTPAAAVAADSPFSIAFWVYPQKITRHPGLTGARAGIPVVASQLTPPPPVEGDAEPAPNTGPRGWAIDLDEGVPALKLYGDGGKLMRALALRNAPLPEKTWSHLTFTYDGSRKEDGLSLYVNGAAVPIERGAYGVQNSNVVRELGGSIKNEAPLIVGGDNKAAPFPGSLADFRIFNRAITEPEARMVTAWRDVTSSVGKNTRDLPAVKLDALRLYYYSRHDTEYRKSLAALDQLNVERRQIQNKASTAIVMQERPDSKATARLLFRGMYDQPREEVEANVPASLPPMPASLPRNRLGLAKWLVDPGNPLTARVAVNRFWQEVFGLGIVKTTADFGSQGEAASHPELLDWLAVEFRDSGWDVKKLFRTMLLSAAYRQSASPSPAGLSKDPENRLLSHGPRFRLDGEMVRDLALSASGLLVAKMGGPPVRPYQPDGVWEATSMLASNTRHYSQDHGEALYRRSLYTLWKRSAPPAAMEIFDGPTRETCVVRRERTDTPLQALVIMNDPQLIEAARNLAQRAASSASLEKQVDYMTVHLLARTFESKERAVVDRSYRDFLGYYDVHPGDAAKLLAIGESKADTKLPPAELAALTMVANQLLSLDETLNK